MTYVRTSKARTMTPQNTVFWNISMVMDTKDISLRWHVKKMAVTFSWWNKFFWYAMMRSLQNYTPYQKVDYIWVHIYGHNLHLLNNASYMDLGKYFLVYQCSDNLTPTDIRTAYYQNITCIIYISWTIQCPGIVLEEALDLSSDRILNEWMTMSSIQQISHHEVGIQQYDCDDL
jgi:hypothetical protein